MADETFLAAKAEDSRHLKWRGWTWSRTRRPLRSCGDRMWGCCIRREATVRCTPKLEVSGQTLCGGGLRLCYGTCSALACTVSLVGGWNRG